MCVRCRSALSLSWSLLLPERFWSSAEVVAGGGVSDGDVVAAIETSCSNMDRCLRRLPERGAFSEFKTFSVAG